MRRIAALLVLAACGSSTSSDPAGADGGTGGGGGDGGAATGDGGGGGGAPVLFGEVSHGDGTYYAADGSGNCSFDPSPTDLDVAAMNAPQYANSAVCGECVEVTGPKGKVTVRIVDQCPECKSGDLDLSEEAFVKIADKIDGRVPIAWQPVTCQVTGPISYHYKDGTSEYWTAIQVRNHRIPVTKLEIEKNGAFVDAPRVDYNYFILASGAGPGPVKVRVTAVDGHTLTDTLPAATSDVTVPGASQFP